MQKYLWNALGLVFGIAGAVSTSLYLQNNQTLKVDLYAKPPLVSIPPEMLPIVTFGYPEIYRDFIDIWALQVLTESPENPDAEKFMAFLRPILAQKPKMETLYMFACFVVSKTYNKSEYCQEITDIGLKLFPDSFRILMAQAYIFAFKLNKPLQASAYYFMAAEKPNAPSYIKNIAVRLANREEVTGNDLEATMSIMLGNAKGARFQQFLLEHATKVLNKDPKNDH